MNYLKAISSLTLVAMVASCAEDTANQPENPGETQKNYINVSIKMSDSSSRADGGTSGGFENGTEDESKISRIVFAFYNAQGVCVASAGYENPEFSPTTTGSNIESTYTKAVSFELPVGAQLPKSMMVFVNPTSTNVGSLSLNEVKSATRDSYSSTDGFTMNNAVYFKDGVKQVEVNTDASMYYSTEAEAAASEGINVYVERMAVKTELKFDESWTNATPELNNGTEVKKIKFVADKWGLTCTEKKMYLIKYFDPSVYTASFVNDPTSLFSGWNDATNHRSYWANSVTYGRPSSEYPDVSDDLINGPGKFTSIGTHYGKDEPLNYLSYNQILTDINTPLYCNENTLSNFTPSAATSVIIAGHYEYEDGTNVGTFYVRNNEMYDEQALKIFFIKRIMPYLKYEDAEITMTEEMYDKIKGDFVLAHPTVGLNTSGSNPTKNTERLVTLVLKNNISKYKYINSSNEEVAINATNLENINSELYAMASVAEAFTEGKAVFFWALRHLNPNKDGIGFYGAVRNHCYRVTVKSISGLGIGVFDPDAPLVPHEDETEFNIKATVNVLAWKLVNNNAEL